jgi:D-inositol-3-phosphate glycosyltransferase
MHKLAILSMHTSPLAQPGSGDGGGMNVYVRELSGALTRAGVECDVYTRAWSDDLPSFVEVEPGLTVHHVEAGPRRPVAKGLLHELVGEFTEAVADRMAEFELLGAPRTDAIHANYWLSGIAGHALKHRLGIPLVSTFHTLDRVKAEASPEELDETDPGRRARAEAEVIGCSDAILASCSVELDQLVELYGADASRVEIVAPGVDHTFFAPGDKRLARRALGITGRDPLLLFVGRIQPLKGSDVAVRVLASLDRLGVEGARLAVVGGPSGVAGDDEVAKLRALVAELGLEERVAFVPPQPHERLSTYYRAADVCLVPSRSESFGLVALEAAACGTPVVASAVGGLTTIVGHGETGFLVESGGVEVFAGHVAAIVSSPELGRRFGEAAARSAQAYTWSTAAARLRRLYNDLTARTLVECG